MRSLFGDRKNNQFTSALEPMPVDRRRSVGPVAADVSLGPIESVKVMPRPEQKCAGDLPTVAVEPIHFQQLRSYYRERERPFVIGPEMATLQPAPLHIGRVDRPWETPMAQCAHVRPYAGAEAAIQAPIAQLFKSQTTIVQEQKELEIRKKAESETLRFDFDWPVVEPPTASSINALMQTLSNPEGSKRATQPLLNNECARTEASPPRQPLGFGDVFKVSNPITNEALSQPLKEIKKDHHQLKKRLQRIAGQ